MKERERDIEQNVYKWTSVLDTWEKQPFFNCQADGHTDRQSERFVLHAIKTEWNRMKCNSANKSKKKEECSLNGHMLSVCVCVYLC